MQRMVEHSKCQVLGGLIAVGLLGLAGCHETWSYYALQNVQTTLPDLQDTRWSRRRAYTEAEILPISPGGTQTVLLARWVKSDPKDIDADRARTFVIVLDEPIEPGKTYHITPGNGRLLEGTVFRPVWRPYIGLEGDVTILGVSARKVEAAIRVSSVMRYYNDPDRSFHNMNVTFDVITGAGPVLGKMGIRFGEGPTSSPVAYHAPTDNQQLTTDQPHDR